MNAKWLVLPLIVAFAWGEELPEKPKQHPEGSLPAYLASGALPPERCAKYSPSGQLRWLRSDGVYTHEGNTPYQMDAEAEFYEAYAKQLQIKTNELHKDKDIAAAREDLIVVFGEAIDFLTSLETTRNRFDRKKAAHVEWLLYSAHHSYFDPKAKPEGRFPIPVSDADVEAYIRAVTNSRFDFQKDDDPSKLAPRHAERIIKALHRFERHVSEDGKRHFRREVIKLIDNGAAEL
jgi:hypothetical protein